LGFIGGHVEEFSGHFLMQIGLNTDHDLAEKSARSHNSILHVVRNSVLFCIGISVISLSAALLLPKSYGLAFISDTLQMGLVATAAYLSFRNAASNHSNVRAFWFLIFLGTAMWLASLLIWSNYELVLRQDVPDVPFGDILLFVKLVPLSAALALQPHKSYDSRLRAFGLLDVSILIVYALYLYAFWVFAYRLAPGAGHIYDFHFNVADAIGNQIFALVAGIAFLRGQGSWRNLYFVYFLGAATYCLGSDLGNVAIDLGHYYSGSVFDVPLTLSLAALVGFSWEGRRLQGPERKPKSSPPKVGPAPRLSLVSSYFAMIVTLSTPVIGVWLLIRGSSTPQIFSFRLTITLLTIFLLTMLLSIKQHLLTTSLVGSFQNLSETYATISRFRDQLTQNEKLASLGESVAKVANQIKRAMAIIRERSLLLTARPDSETRIQSMAGKIDQYAHRMDVLVENMLRFAQETPLQLTPLEIKPLIESALQLGRTAKLSNIHVTLTQSNGVPRVLGDPSQLLHVFLQIISNAVDALEEQSGGTLGISIESAGSQVRVEFSDTGHGIKEPEQVFEPFYTTKPVGKGTGLGLSTCYGIVQKHGGAISCHNRPEGGATFIVLLPADAQMVMSSLQLATTIEDPS
jgi:signal transduction histidine kinase